MFDYIFKRINYIVMAYNIPLSYYDVYYISNHLK